MDGLSQNDPQQSSRAAAAAAAVAGLWRNGDDVTAQHTPHTHKILLRTTTVPHNLMFGVHEESKGYYSSTRTTQGDRRNENKKMTVCKNAHLVPGTV